MRFLCHLTLIDRIACAFPLAKILLLAIMLGVFTGPMPSYGADVARVSIGAHEKSSRFVRLGLNKSMIVDLPREAADVLVSNPKIADAVMRTASRAYLIGMQVGMTNIFFFDAAGQQIAGVELQVERDLSVLSRMIRQLIPDSRVAVEAINDNVVLTGAVAKPTDADRAVDLAARFIGKPEQVLSMLAVDAKEQVHLKVTIAEVRRSIIKQFGINLEAALSSGNIASGILSANGFPLANKSLLPVRLAGTYTKGNDTARATVNMLEQSGILRVLAEPTLSAITGESAKFLAGGEFPVPVGRDEDGKVTVAYKQFGVGLAFTPVVMSEGRISLKVATEVSELTDENALVFTDGNGSIRLPGLKVRRADTTIELPSGGSLVLAGLLQQENRQAISGTPGLKDLPVLGALFRSRDYINNDTELMVMVTPYLVDPVAKDELVRPDKNFHSAADAPALLLGRLHRIYGAAGAKPSGRFNGNIGFIVK